LAAQAGPFVMRAGGQELWCGGSLPNIFLSGTPSRSAKHLPPDLASSTAVDAADRFKGILSREGYFVKSEQLNRNFCACTNDFTIYFEKLWMKK